MLIMDNQDRSEFNLENFWEDHESRISDDDFFFKERMRWESMPEMEYMGTAENSMEE